MFDWSHKLHRQLYGVLADDRIPDADKDQRVAEPGSRRHWTTGPLNGAGCFALELPRRVPRPDSDNL